MFQSLSLSSQLFEALHDFLVFGSEFGYISSARGLHLTIAQPSHALSEGLRDTHVLHTVEIRPVTMRDIGTSRNRKSWPRTTVKGQLALHVASKIG